MKDNNYYHEELATDGKTLDLYFGIVFSCLLFAMSLIPLVQGGKVRLWPMSLAIVILLVSFLSPVLLSPLRKLWMKFGLLIQQVSHPLILGIIFYAVLTPVALIMRCCGKDSLMLHTRPDIKSYWQLRNLYQVNKDMKNQF